LPLPSLSLLLEVMIVQARGEPLPLLHPAVVRTASVSVVPAQNGEWWALSARLFNGAGRQLPPHSDGRRYKPGSGRLCENCAQASATVDRSAEKMHIAYDCYERSLALQNPQRQEKRVPEPSATPSDLRFEATAVS